MGPVILKKEVSWPNKLNQRTQSTEVIGTSTVSWEDAAKNAVETASRTVRDLRIAEVVKMDLKVVNGKVLAYRTRVLLSFKYGS